MDHQTAMTSISRVISKPMSYMRKRRTAARMRAKGFSSKVIAEQLWSRL